MELPQAIAAVLFYQAEPYEVGRLAKLLKKSEGEVRDALGVLATTLEQTGIRLVRNGDEVTLGTAPEASSLIEAITKEELSRELSKAALETLSIILYKGPVTRSEIDHIRGVNSTFILRNLQVRNLVERIENPDDQRSFLYKPTFQLLEFMGVTKIEDLPEYHQTIATLDAFSKEREEEQEKEEAGAEADDALPAQISQSEILVGEEATDFERQADEEEDADLANNYDDPILAERLDKHKEGV